MSKVLGIIAEYNPFHNGHYYHLQKSKKETGSKYTIAVISGNFTQRGSTSLVNKWSKAKMALASGIDLVLELPVLYAISSAENFAEGSIKILDSLKIVDTISFGAETPHLELLNSIADVLVQEPKEFKSILSHELKKGLSFPKARENALMMYLNDIRKYAGILSSPNNILGIEYLKALKRKKSNIAPYCLERFESDYNSTGVNGNMASSTAIRNIIKNNGFHILPKLMPESSYSILMDELKIGHIVPDLSTFEKEIIYTLRKMSLAEIAELPDVSEGLEYAIKNAANSCNSLIEFFNIIQSKRYANTRLRRILLYALFGIQKKDMQTAKKVTPYARVLGWNDNGKYLISEITKANPKLEIITSVKKYADENTNKNNRILLEKDIDATNIYTIGYQNDSWSNLDFTHKLEYLE